MVWTEMEFRVTQDGRLYLNGDYVGTFKDEATAADMAVCHAQNIDAPRYTIWYDR